MFRVNRGRPGCHLRGLRRHQGKERNNLVAGTVISTCFPGKKKIGSPENSTTQNVWGRIELSVFRGQGLDFLYST